MVEAEGALENEYLCNLDTLRVWHRCGYRMVVHQLFMVDPRFGSRGSCASGIRLLVERMNDISILALALAMYAKAHSLKPMSFAQLCWDGEEEKTQDMWIRLAKERKAKE